METKVGQILRRPRKTKSPLKRVLNIVGNILFICALVSLAVILFFTFQSKLKGEAPTLLGYKLYVVLSGSMEPTLHTGSVVIVKPADPKSLALNDVITFKGFDDSNVLVTHRIVGINPGEPQTYTTRGDANDATDPRPISAVDVVGKVNLTIPYAGYIMDFAKTKKGLLVLVIVPGALIILLEMRNLLKYAVLLDREKQEKTRAEQEKKATKEGSEVITTNYK